MSDHGMTYVMLTNDDTLPEQMCATIDAQDKLGLEYHVGYYYHTEGNRCGSAKGLGKQPDECSQFPMVFVRKS